MFNNNRQRLKIRCSRYPSSIFLLNLRQEVSQFRHMFLRHVGKGTLKTLCSQVHIGSFKRYMISYPLPQKLLFQNFCKNNKRKSFQPHSIHLEQDAQKINLTIKVQRHIPGRTYCLPALTFRMLYKKQSESQFLLQQL